MKSIILSVAAALMLWGSSAMTSQADAQYVRYNRGYSSTTRYYNRGYSNGSRYYSGYRGGYYAPQTYYRPSYGGNYGNGYYGNGYYGNSYYGNGYYGSGYGNSYYGGGYNQPGVSIGVGRGRIGIGF